MASTDSETLTGHANLGAFDMYSANMTTPLIYITAESTTDDIAAIYVKSTLTSGDNASGVTGYFETHIAGTTSGHTYGFGSWINVDTSAVLSAGHIIVPIEGGVYAGEAQASARIVFAGQHQAILTGAPTSLHAWRLNTTHEITALIAAANAGSVHFGTGQTASTAAGTIAIADIVGTGVVYVQVYTTSA